MFASSTSFSSTRRLLAACALVACALPTLALAQARFTVAGYAAPVAKDWIAQPPSSNMRAAQYIAPGKTGDAEVIVFYFGKGQGGPVEANIERWVTQFTAKDGKPVKPKTQKLSANGLAMTTVELNGAYAPGVGMGQQGDARPNQTLLVAIAETPAGNVTMQLRGPQATVAAHRKSFEAMYRGFKKAN